MATSADVVLRLEQRVRRLQIALGGTLLLFAVAAVAIGLIVRELAAIRRDGQSGELVRGAQLRVDTIWVSHDGGNFETLIDPTGIHIAKTDVSDGRAYVEASLRGDQLSLQNGRGAVRLSAQASETLLRLEQGQHAMASIAARPDGAELSMHLERGSANFRLAEDRGDTGFRFFPDLGAGAGAWLEFDEDRGPTLQLIKGDAGWKADPSTPR